MTIKQGVKNQTFSYLRITNQQPEKIAMASSTTETTTVIAEQTRPADNNHKAPLELKGVLDQFKSFDVTPVIGKEFPEVNLKSLLRAENSDELIRDLAIISKLFPRNLTLILTHMNSIPARCRLLPQAR